MEMTVVTRDDGVSHVVLAGRLDATGVEEIGDSLAGATSARERPAIVDLSGIEFMASRGVGLLFANGKRLMKSGHKLVLLNPQEMVNEVLKTVHADKLMPIAHSLDEAVRIARCDRIASGATSAPPEAPPPEQAPAARAVSEGRMSAAIENELSELPRLNAELARFLDSHGVPHRAAYAVNLAIDELVVNVIRYAYVDGDTHLIDIELAVEGEQVILRIVDDGRPFDPRGGPALDLHAEDRDAGGLGIFLVLDMVDVLKYERVDDKNHVEVRVHLFPDDGQQPAEGPAASSETDEV